MYAIILAAGLSKRMGTQKILLPLGESTVLETVLHNMHAAGFTKICAVLSSEVDAQIKERPAWLETTVNAAPERGQSSSLAAGLAMLPEGADFCIMLGDLPFAKPGEIARRREAFEKLPPGKTVLAPLRSGAFGHPMFYKAQWKARFASAEGDTGGKTILRRHWNEIESVEADEGHFKDLDTPEDYRSSRTPQ